MNKRKAPVMLFGLVVVAIAVMAVINAGSNPNGMENKMEDKHEEVTQHNMTEQDRKAAAADAVAGLPSKGDSPKGPGMSKNLAPAADSEMPGTSMAPATKPTILVKRTQSFRPRPNDSSTSTQWYIEKSRAAKIASDNAKAKG